MDGMFNSSFTGIALAVVPTQICMYVYVSWFCTSCFVVTLKTVLQVFFQKSSLGYQLSRNLKSFLRVKQLMLLLTVRYRSAN